MDDISEKIWKFTFECKRKRSGMAKMMGVVIADDEAQAREIISTLIRPDIQKLKVEKATTYPLILCGGYCKCHCGPNTFVGFVKGD